MVFVVFSANSYWNTPKNDNTVNQVMGLLYYINRDNKHKRKEIQHRKAAEHWIRFLLEEKVVAGGRIEACTATARSCVIPGPGQFVGAWGSGSWRWGSFLLGGGCCCRRSQSTLSFSFQSPFLFVHFSCLNGSSEVQANPSGGNVPLVFIFL